MTTDVRLVVLLAGAGLLSQLTGCSVQPLQFRSEVDSLAAADAANKKRFVILPGNKDTDEHELQFQEFKAYAEKALSNRGYSKANSLQDGDVVVLLSYGIGSPENHQYSYETPIWGDIGGYYYPYPRSRFYGYMPVQGVTGYTQHIESYTTYKRYLLLDAYDMQSYRQQKMVQLWKTSVSSDGTSNDLRLAFPYMVTAMLPYIGTNTGHMIRVDVDEFNPQLRDLLGPFQPPAAPPAIAVPQK